MTLQISEKPKRAKREGSPKAQAQAQAEILVGVEAPANVSGYISAPGFHCSTWHVVYNPMCVCGYPKPSPGGTDGHTASHLLGEKVLRIVKVDEVRGCPETLSASGHWVSAL